ncbi:MAG TPA: hypothetical protein PLV42_06070 [bacterium]|nr:hypothetical protein [bacterium]
MKRFALVLLIVVTAYMPLHARQKMDFMLFNLGSSAEGIADFEMMATQFAAVIAPMFHGEAESRGAEGFELGFGYSFTKINYTARYWTNALNDKPTDMQVPTFYNGVDIHAKKGFSFGLVVYGNLRYYILTEMISGGVGMEYVVNEGLKNWPDISLGAGYNGLFGAYDLNMHEIELRAKISKTFVAKKEVKLIPFLAYSHLFTFAWSNRLGGYWPITDGTSYYGDPQGAPFYFDETFLNIDRVILGFKFSRANFGFTIEGALPFNAYKAFSLNTGFAVVF